MAYWGYKTKANFIVWLIVTVLLVTGAIWLIIGGVATSGCNFCYSEFNKDGTPKNPSKLHKGCNVLAYSFNLYSPEKAAEPDARGNMWAFCMYGGGAVGELAAGATMFTLGLIFLTYFCFARKPEPAIPVAQAL